MEVTGCHIPIVKGFTIPLSMGMREASCPIILEAGAKSFQGTFYYDPSAQGYRIGSAKRFTRILEEVGAHVRDVLEFNWVSHDEITGVIHVRVTKRAPNAIPGDAHEVTSSSLRRCTLIVAKGLTGNKLEEGELEHLLSMMDHKEVTALLEHVLHLLKERPEEVWDLQNGLHAIMCALLATSPSVHVGFAAMVAIFFQVHVEVKGDGHYYEYLDYMLYTFGRKHMVLSLHLVPHCDMRTFRRFPRTSLMLVLLELCGQPTVYRGHKILSMLCNVDVIMREDEVLLPQMKALFDTEMLYVFQDVLIMAQQFLMRPLYTNYTTSCDPQLSSDALRSGCHLR